MSPSRRISKQRIKGGDTASHRSLQGVTSKGGSDSSSDWFRTHPFSGSDGGSRSSRDGNLAALRATSGKLRKPIEDDSLSITTEHTRTPQSSEEEKPSQTRRRNKLRRKDADDPRRVVLNNLKQLKDLPPFVEDKVKEQITDIHAQYEGDRKKFQAQYEEDLKKLNSSDKSSDDTSKGAEKLAAELKSNLANAKETWRSRLGELNNSVLAGTLAVMAGVAHMMAERRASVYIDHKVEKTKQKGRVLEGKFSEAKRELEEHDKKAWALHENLLQRLIAMSRIETKLLAGEEPGSDRPPRGEASSSRQDLAVPVDKNNNEGHEAAHRKIVFDLYAQTLSTTRANRLTQEKAKQVGQEASKESSHISGTDDYEKTLKDLNDPALSPEERATSVNTLIENYLQYHPRLSSADVLTAEPPIIDKCRAFVELAKKQPGEDVPTDSKGKAPVNRYSTEEQQARTAALDELVKDFPRYKERFASESHIHTIAARHFSTQVAAVLERLDTLANDDSTRKSEVAQARQGIYNALAAIHHLSPEVSTQITDIYKKFNITESSPSDQHQTADQRFQRAFKAMQEGRKEAPVPGAQLDLSPIEAHLKLKDPASLASLPDVVNKSLAKLAQLGETKEGSKQGEENIQEYRRQVELIEKKYASQIQKQKDTYERAKADNAHSLMSRLPEKTWFTNRKDQTNRLDEKTPDAKGPMTDKERRMAEAKEQWRQTLAQRDAEIAAIDQFYKPMTLGRVSTEVKALAAQLEAALKERDAVLAKMGSIQVDINRNDAYEEKFSVNQTAKVLDLENQQQEQKAKIAAVESELTTAIHKKTAIAEERDRREREVEKEQKTIEIIMQEFDTIRNRGESSIMEAQRDVNNLRSKLKEKTPLESIENKYTTYQDINERTWHALNDIITDYEAKSENEHYKSLIEQCKEYRRSLETLKKVQSDHQAALNQYNEKFDISRKKLDSFLQSLSNLEETYLAALNDVFKVEGKKNDVQAQANIINEALRIAKEHDNSVDKIYFQFLEDARGIIKTEHGRYAHAQAVKQRMRQLSWMLFLTSFGGAANTALQQMAVSSYLPILNLIVSRS